MPGFRLSSYVILEEDVPIRAGAFPLLASVPECVPAWPWIPSVRTSCAASSRLLGVIIGVASVIMVGAAIDGLGVYAEQSTAKAFGSESFLVAQIAATGRLSRREYFDKVKRNKPIRTDDARFLESVNGDRVLYSPYRNHTSDIKRENLTCEDTTVIGTSADMADIRDIGVIDGRFFTTQEDHSRAFVAVIGDTVRDHALSRRISPLGEDRPHRRHRIHRHRRGGEARLGLRARSG